MRKVQQYDIIKIVFVKVAITMELQKIRILNYKSIKESIEIPFTNEGGIVTFIGKNGSGKHI